MRQWRGKCEDLPLYDFTVTEVTDNKYDLKIEWLKSSSNFTFPSIAAARAFINKDYGKVSLKLLKN